MAETGIFYSNIKVFIAGILVYPLSVTIQSSFNDSPKATIALPADVRLFNLGRYDRVPVQVFVLESMVESSKYILMFEGFIAARTYSNTATERQLVFTCADYTEVFNDTKLKFITSIDECGIGMVNGESAIAQHVFKSNMKFPMCLFYEGLGYSVEGSSTFETTEGILKMPTQYLANIMAFLEEAGFGYATAGRFNDSIVSRYYAILSNNLHLDRRFCWLPFFDFGADDSSGGKNFSWEYEGITREDVEAGKVSVMFPVLYGVRADQAIKKLESSVQASTKEYTVHDLIYFLIDRMEYDFLVIPNPAFQKARSQATDIGAWLDNKKPVVLTEDLMGSWDDVSAESPVTLSEMTEVMQPLKERYSYKRDCDRLIHFCVKPMLDDTFPPACNIVFRSQVVSISTATQFNQSPTRIQVSNFTREPQGSSGTNSQLLHLLGSVDFYPSDKFGENIPLDARAAMSCKLLDIEKRTGPWITRDRAPDWMYYTLYSIAVDTATTDDPVIKQVKKMQEQYMRRQLMRAQVLNRQLTAQCVFLPYITCGFPAVFFDAANTGFAFVGNVIAIEHHISPNDMSTTVVINGVRLLSEAATDEQEGRYPNPINAVHAVTHNKDNMSKVYQTILGYPEGNDYPGANAYTWDEIIEKWYGKVNDAASSPQTNIYKAYQVQKRNIATLEQYADFMGMSYNGTDLSSEWLSDRTKLTTQNSIPLQQKILPVSILTKAESEKKEIEKKKSELEKKAQEAKDTAQKAQEAYNKGLEEKNAKVKAAQDKVSALNTEISKTENPSDKLQHDYNVATSELYTAYNDYQQYQKTEKAKVDEITKQQSDLVDGYNKEIAKLNQGIGSLNAQANTSKSDDNFANVSEKDVRELLTEIRAKSEKHYIY